MFSTINCGEMSAKMGRLINELYSSNQEIVKHTLVSLNRYLYNLNISLTESRYHMMASRELQYLYNSTVVSVVQEIVSVAEDGDVINSAVQCLGTVNRINRVHSSSAFTAEMSTIISSILHTTVESLLHLIRNKINIEAVNFLLLVASENQHLSLKIITNLVSVAMKKDHWSAVEDKKLRRIFRKPLIDIMSKCDHGLAQHIKIIFSILGENMKIVNSHLKTSEPFLTQYNSVEPTLSDEPPTKRMKSYNPSLTTSVGEYIPTRAITGYSTTVPHYTPTESTRCYNSYDYSIVVPDYTPTESTGGYNSYNYTNHNTAVIDYDSNTSSAGPANKPAPVPHFYKSHFTNYEMMET